MHWLGGVCPRGCLPGGLYPSIHWVGRGWVYPSMHWPGGCLLQCKLGYTPTPMDRVLDTRLWKHYLSTTTLQMVQIVTNITLTGSAMVNWNRRLLIKGVTTVIMVNVCALGHFVGWSVSIKGSRSPKHRKQTRLGWVVGILVYSSESRHSYRWLPGSATDRHGTIGTSWNSSRLRHSMHTKGGLSAQPLHWPFSYR